MPIIDALEVIHVDQQDRERRPVPRRPLHLGGESKVEGAAIGQTGQLIRDGEHFELLLHFLAVQQREM
nr:hypothetical protein [Xanthobacter dioxanivorans]